MGYRAKFKSQTASAIRKPSLEKISISMIQEKIIKLRLKRYLTAESTSRVRRISRFAWMPGKGNAEPETGKYKIVLVKLFNIVHSKYRATKTVEKYIRTTKTTTGLKVKARIVKKQYEKGKSASDYIFNNFKKLYLKPYSKLPIIG